MQAVDGVDSRYFSPRKTRKQRNDEEKSRLSVAEKKVDVIKEENLPPSSKVSKRERVKVETKSENEAEKKIENAKLAESSPPKIKKRAAVKKEKATLTAIKDSEESEEAEEAEKAPPKAKVTPKRRKLGPMNEVVPDIEDCGEKWMPQNWSQVLANIREMRKDRSAPVDTMGCHKCSDHDADEKVSGH